MEDLGSFLEAMCTSRSDFWSFHTSGYDTWETLGKDKCQAKI